VTRTPASPDFTLPSTRREPHYIDVNLTPAGIPTVNAERDEGEISLSASGVTVPRRATRSRRTSRGPIYRYY